MRVLHVIIVNEDVCHHLYFQFLHWLFLLIWLFIFLFLTTFFIRRTELVENPRPFAWFWFFDLVLTDLVKPVAVGPATGLWLRIYSKLGRNLALN